MTKTLIVPDIHGHYETLFDLLLKAGVLNDDGERQDGFRVIQLGDLANCVADDIDGDIACLKAASEFGWIDEMLIGNHEHPYFGGPAFHGFARVPEVEAELRSLDRQGILRAAALVGAQDDVLVTHAGFVPSEGVTSASEGYLFANQMWSEDKTHPVFSQIGLSRGGRSNNGGILWSDWMEKKSNEFNQIVGHTPQKRGVSRRNYDSTGNWSLCIDIGAKYGTGCTGVLFDDDTDDFTFVETKMSGNHW